MKRCAHCGQIIPPKIIFGGVKQRVYDFIAAHPEGVQRWQIMAAVYADDIDGGPESPNVICVHLNHMRKKLAEHGVQIHTRPGRGAVYRLVAL